MHLDLIMERNFFYLMIAGFLPQGIHFLLLPIYTSSMGLEEFGKIGLAMVLLNISTALGAFQIQNSVGRLYFDYKHELRLYFSTIAVSIFAMSVIFSAISLNLNSYLGKLFFSSNPNFSLLISLTIISIPFACVNQFLDKWFIVRRQGRELLIRVVISSISSAVLGIYLIVFQEMGAEGYISALLFGYFLATVLSVIVLRELLQLKFSTSIFSRSIKFSFPLIFGAIGSMVFIHLGVFILEKYVTLAFVGLFVLADRISNVLKLFVNQSGRLVAPLITGIYTSDPKSGKKLADDIFFIWCFLSLPIFTLFILISNLLIVLLFPHEYLVVADLLPYFCLGLWFRGFYIYESMYLFAEKKTGYIASIGILAGLCFSLICFILTSNLGVWGAVYAQLIGLSLPYFACLIITQRLNLRLTSATIAVPTTIFLIAYLVFLNSMISQIGNLAGISVVLFLLVIVFASLLIIFHGHLWKKYNGVRTIYKEGSL